MNKLCMEEASLKVYVFSSNNCSEDCSSFKTVWIAGRLSLSYYKIGKYIRGVKTKQSLNDAHYERNRHYKRRKFVPFQSVPVNDRLN